MAYGASLPDLYRRTAAYMDKILKEAKPGDLPVQHPVQLEFVLNLKTAQALGVAIPQSVLMQVTEVIQQRRSTPPREDRWFVEPPFPAADQGKRRPAEAGRSLF